MKEMVLYYTPKKSPKTVRLKGVLVRMGIRIRNITSQQAGQRIGYLVGLDGYEQTDVDDQLPGIDEEILIMHGFTDVRIDELLKNFRKAGVPGIDLKAIVTQSNAPWTLYQLYEELKKEHQRMHQGSSSEDI